MKALGRLPKWLKKEHINNSKSEEDVMRVNDLVKVRAIKIGDNDRYIITVGRSRATTTIYTSQEQAEKVVEKLDPDLLEIITAICGEIITCNNEKSK